MITSNSDTLIQGLGKPINTTLDENDLFVADDIAIIGRRLYSGMLAFDEIQTILLEVGACRHLCLLVRIEIPNDIGTPIPDANDSHFDHRTSRCIIVAEDD